MKTSRHVLFRILLCLILCMSMLPAASFAAGVTGATGTGTKDNPYVVSSWDGLKNCLNASANDDGEKKIYVKLGSSFTVQNPGEINVDPEDGSQLYSLDLNGNTIQVINNNTNQLFTVKDGITFEIKDSAVGGGIDDYSTKKHIFYGKNHGNLTIYGGSFSTWSDDVFYIDSPPKMKQLYLNIYGGTFTGAKNCIRVEKAQQIHLYGGTFRNRSSASDEPVIHFVGAGVSYVGGLFSSYYESMEYNMELSRSVVVERENTGIFFKDTLSEANGSSSVWASGLTLPAQCSVLVDGHPYTETDENGKPTTIVTNFEGKQFSFGVKSHGLTVQPPYLNGTTAEQPISISLSGLHSVAVTSVTVDNTDVFEITKPAQGVILYDNDTNADYWIKGKSGLSPGTYTGTITVTYWVGGNTLTETAVVTCTVEDPSVEDEEPVITAPTFRDVKDGDYFKDAVDWAVEKGITSGTSDSTFSPDAACTRAQSVTFLWRANDKETVSGSNPFTDVSSGDYFYQPVLWAVKKGITKGTSNTTFSPEENCTRAQIVTFLYRAAGEPAASGSLFQDVASDAYYANAVRWAVANGITSGTSSSTFSPDEICTRAQIVTFIYRQMK